MGDSNGTDVGFEYEWSGDAYTTTQWSYHVIKRGRLAWRLLGVVRRDLSHSEEHLHEYTAFENVQHTNQVFPTLEEAKAWVVACTMGEKP